MSNSTPVTLSDGSRIAIRPIRPDDRELLTDAFERLGPEARYRRFFRPIRQLSDRELDFLTDVDHHDHEALVALDPGGAAIGVARFVRVDAEAAEPAIVVVDDWQGRGVAGRLLDRLADRAREEGVNRFRALVLADNPNAMHVLERLGETTRHSQGTEVELDIDLGEVEAAGLDLRELLRATAGGALAPARTFWDRLAWRVRVGYEGRTEPWREGGELGDAIVLGTDGSTHAGIAERRALELARALGAPVHVVAAYTPGLTPRARVEERTQRSVALLREAGLQADAHVRRGDAAEAIVEVAEHERARFIVVGWGRARAVRPWFGDVADKVSRHAPCHVLIAR